MNMEELKLIAETISKLGDAGQAAFVWWLVADKIVPALTWAACISVVMFTIYRVVMLLSAEDRSEKMSLDERALEALRQAWLYGKSKHSTALYTMYKELEKLVGKP